MHGASGPAISCLNGLEGGESPSPLENRASPKARDAFVSSAARLSPESWLSRALGGCSMAKGEARVESTAEKTAHAVTADKTLPIFAWTRRLDDIPDISRFRPGMPGVIESLALIPLAMRMGAYVSKERREGRDPIFDLNGVLLQPPNPGPYAGVPLGGLGGGCIGRGFLGDFRRWNLQPGRYRHHLVLADQFSVRVKRGSKVYSQVLSVHDGTTSGALKGWKWGMQGKCATYHALYPRAWTVYEEAVPMIRLTCRQVSPVIPHDYIDSSLPVATFVWHVENLGTEPAEVSIMFTFQNGTGSEEDKAGGHYNRAFAVKEGSDSTAPSVIGVQLRHAVRPAMDYDPLTDKAPSPPRRQPGFGKCTEGPEIMLINREESEDSAVDTEVKGKCSCRDTVKGVGAALCCLPRSSDEDNAPPSPDTFTFALVADCLSRDVSVSTYSQFQTNGSASDRGKSAREVWDQFVSQGELREPGDLPADWWEHPKAVRELPHRGVGVRERTESVIHYPGPVRRAAIKDTIGAGVCQKVTVGGNSHKTLSFSLAWDIPLVRFGGGLALPRRYTRFYGMDGRAAPVLATHALRRVKAWEAAIERWQRPVLEDPDLPAFYKHMLFNELYYMTDGGTVWTDSKAGGQRGRSFDVIMELESGKSEEELNQVYKACQGDQDLVGQFMYLEGHEYLMYNTYDVHFYASFALAMLWPMLELSLQNDIADAVMSEDTTMRKLIARAEIRPRKVYGSVPHDMGCPSGRPWKELNSYNLQDVNRWKDLGPKLVLQVYRDFVITRSMKFIERLWPVLVHVMQANQEFDLDGDGLIENSGFPDQTYDIWTVEGPSAYTGGLWVGALTAMAAMGTLLGDVENAGAYQAHADRARAAYIRHLWNEKGGYFNYDASASVHHDSIMADQMAGQWYMRACGLPPVVDPHMARSSLMNVYNFNVRKFADGLSGAVNGMRPNGAVDNTCLQSKEVWTGTTYSVAAAMLQEATLAHREAHGMAEGGLHLKEQADYLRHAAFETARGIYEAGWKRLGYWFCTPEAWDQHGCYRSLGYMRPLCIWSMHWALTCPSPGPIDVVPLDIMVPRSITDVLEVIAATPVIEEQKTLPVPLPEGGDNDEDGDVGDEK